jgi:anti-sigma B factor antagonist
MAHATHRPLAGEPPSGGDLRVERCRRADAVILSIRGDITVGGNGGQIADAVRCEVQEGLRYVILDLGRVRYIDSVGLGELVQALSAVRYRGGALKLLHVTDQLTELLAVTRLQAAFDCYERESDAIESCAPGGTNGPGARQPRPQHDNGR